MFWSRNAIQDVEIPVMNDGSADRTPEISVSMLEAIARIEEISGTKLNWKYIEQNWIGDHICYISDLGKLKSHYRWWGITVGIDEILRQIIAAQSGRDEN